MARDPIVDGPEPGPLEKLRQRLGRGKPGAQPSEPSPPATSDDPDLAELERMEAGEATERAEPPTAPEDKDEGLVSIPLSWKPWVVGPVGLALALFHLAPHLADLAGEPRTVLAGFRALPFGETISNAAAGWLWEPLWVWVAATALRLRALQRMFRDPPQAVMMALIAAAFEAGFWIFMGLKKTGEYSPAEASALILLLKIEGAAILGLLFLFAPTGKKKLGETDAHWNRG